MKLLIASLCLGQVNSQREQLRGRNAKESLDERERNLQVAPTFTFEEQEGYDDYFELPTDVAFSGGQAASDYFTETGDGMEYHWESASGGRVESGGGYFEDATDPPKIGKFTKAVKSAKSKEGRYFAKSGKSGKAFKSAKKGKSVKGQYMNTRAYDDKHDGHYEGDVVVEAEHDDYFGGTSFGAAFVDTGPSYADYFAYDPTTTGRTESDDYFNPAPKPRSEVEGRSSFQHRSSANQQQQQQQRQRQPTTFDDDFFNEEEVVIFRPRPVVTVGGSVFSVNPQTLIPPLVPDGSGNTLTVGTEYLFSEELEDAANVNSQLVPVDVDNARVNFLVNLDGYCDRIGPQDQNSVQGYCFFTYTFIDPQTRFISGAFTAQGIIVNAQVPGQLTITGGTGMMTGASGLVEVLPAAIDNGRNPPLLIQPQAGADPFNDVSGWAHFFEFDVDVLFFLPDLYAQ